MNPPLVVDDVGYSNRSSLPREDRPLCVCEHGGTVRTTRTLVLRARLLPRQAFGAEVRDAYPLRGPVGLGLFVCGYPVGMEPAQEVEFVFEPQQEGGYHVYAPELPGLHTEGDSLEEATESAREALELYVEGLREDGRSLEMGIVRRTLPLPA